MRDNIGDEDENMLIINTNTLNNEKILSFIKYLSVWINLYVIIRQ